VKILLALGVLGFTYLKFIPNQYKFHCPIWETTGVYCPGCGTTRALISLLDGNSARAIQQNSLIFTAPLFVLMWHLTQRSKLRKLASILFYVQLGLVVLSFLIARNIPGSPLAPNS
jgi:Protein of unknown function (DUF2752)